MIIGFIGFLRLRNGPVFGEEINLLSECQDHHLGINAHPDGKQDLKKMFEGLNLPIKNVCWFGRIFPFLPFNMSNLFHDWVKYFHLSFLGFKFLLLVVRVKKLLYNWEVNDFFAGPTFGFFVDLGFF